MNVIVLKPRMSEKTYALSNSRVYAFDIEKSVNKHEVKTSVEKTYDVSVINVRTVITKGKKKRSYKNRRYENGTRSNVKKAYVTLKEGDAIPIFAAVEEAEEKQEKTAKIVEKAAQKQAKKEAKKGKE